MTTNNETNAVEMAHSVLAAHPDFRILRRFVPKDSYGTAPEGVKLLKGVILDTETTGRDANVDRIIELGMIVFEFDPETGIAYRILATYNELEDPGMPIPEAATAVNHITDEMVKGKRIDDAAVEELVRDADIIIAHNSSFDRAFMERRMPIFLNKPWACSLKQISWESEGIGSAKLDYICYLYGFFFEGHRAEVDCRALLEMLQHKLPKSQVTGLKQMLTVFQHEETNIGAIDTRFAVKDVLKGRGYRWDGNGKFWHTNVTQEAYEAEVAWLRTEVYSGKPFSLSVLKVNAFNRFSDRAVAREQVFP